MANIEKFIPILYRWETGITVKPGETNEAAFARAKKVGFACDPDDTGGATMVGVTIGTYTAYRKNKGLKTPSVQDLKNISYDEWKDIVYTMFWNKWKADMIEDQTVANMVVDWVWHSGTGTIKKVQTALGVTADGIVGPKTIAKLNSTPDIKTKVYNARKAYFDAIIARNPSQNKWMKGWMNRLNYIYNL